MPNQKTLVIGSTRHLHVTSVPWTDVETVNIVDYQTVVINTRSLTDGFLSNSFKVFLEMRTALSRLLQTEGRIIVIGDLPRNVKLTHRDDRAFNYGWSPIKIGVDAEAGDSIEIDHEAFPKYLNHFRHWDSYYFIPPTTWLTTEFYQLVGPLPTSNFRLMALPYRSNRYSKLLAGSYFATYEDHARRLNFGELTLLPYISTLDPRDAVNLVLEDLLDLPQLTLPPDWVQSVEMPIIPEIEHAIGAREATIAAIRAEITEYQTQKEGLEKYKKLLYASGLELEDIFAQALIKCGGSVKAAAYSQEEFILEYKNKVYLIECKGIGRSMALTHVRQVVDYMMKFEEDTGRKGKGILLGNPWRDRPPAERGRSETVIYPPNVITRAAELGVSLVWSVDFFEVFCKFLSEGTTGERILDQITNQTGVVQF
jgi:hypothetical protein